MRVTFLGTGTSTGVPYINCDCEVCRSTDERDKRLRASVLINNSDTTILIDCGPDFRQQVLRHPVNKINALLLTHQHFDHVGGMDDLRPFPGINVYAEPYVCDAVRRNMPYVFEGNYPGVPKIILNEMKSLEPFTVGSMIIQPIRCYHAALPIVGYRIANFAYMTDLSSYKPEDIAGLDGVEFLVVDALRKKPHFSHFSLEQAIDFAKSTSASTVYFTHCSHDMGKFVDVEPNLPAGFHLAYDELTIEL